MRKMMIFSAILCLYVLLMSTTAFAGGFLVKEGMRGDSVLAVQKLLIAHGYLADGEADGVCGKKTTAAITKFQQENGLDADGICGRMTYKALSGGEEPPAVAAPAAEQHPEHPEQPVSRGGGRSLLVAATAYSRFDPGLSNHTASGTLVRKGVIAVDPAVIPMGTRVFIPGYGEAVAEDIGSAIRGNTIDIAFETAEEAIQFGRKTIEIFIMD